MKSRILLSARLCVAVILMATLAWILIHLILERATPNTGHELELTPIHAIESGSSLTLSWALTAPDAGKPLKWRIEDAKCHYRIDERDWTIMDCKISEENDGGRLLIRAEIPEAEIGPGPSVAWYLTYIFDGSESKMGSAAEPMVTTIETKSQGAEVKRGQRWQ